MGKEFFDISIPLDPHGPQPRAFGAESAVAITLGDTRTGSSVNFERYAFSPHCSGTHTECVGHITHERISVRARLDDIIIPALLVSVGSDPHSSEPYAARESGDLLLTAERIEESLNAVSLDHRKTLDAGALVVRTLPNDERKLSAVYDETSIPPYFTDQAMDLIADLGVKHLLVDLPSIDRISDGGILSNHRKFWNVPLGSFEAGESSRRNATITELIYVPNTVPDGAYQLNLQIAPFEAEATPSRPILMRERQ